MSFIKRKGDIGGPTLSKEVIENMYESDWTQQFVRDFLFSVKLDSNFLSLSILAYMSQIWL